MIKQKLISETASLLAYRINFDWWNLRVQGLWRLKHVQQFRVVNLQKHACDLSRKCRMQSLDKRIQPLTCMGCKQFCHFN